MLNIRWRRLLKTKATERLQRDIDREDVINSGLFDETWYLDTYPDVAAARIDPLTHFMDLGWRELRKPNVLFDTAWYLTTFPDVEAEGCNPLLHYIRHGAVEMRDTSERFRPSIFQDPATPRGAHHLAAATAYLSKIDNGTKSAPHRAVYSSPPRILIIAELTIPQCRKYRVDQKAELLQSIGYDSTILNWHDAAACEAAIDTHAIVIFYRVPAVESVLRCIRKAKALHVPTFWEVDDLIFDPNTYLMNASLGVLSPHIQQSVLSGVPLYRAAMLACDAAIASTHVLAQAMRDAGVPITHVVPNALDKDTIEAARKASIAARRSDRTIRIVYGSGTNTHDADFLEAAPGILATLIKYPHVRLRLVGDIGLPDTFKAFAKRIERYPTASYSKYLSLLAECDISIAPLEPTLFNDAKSNIKYIEAAMVGLPSVCSPRAEFSRIIRHGENGYLADSDDDWAEAFSCLVDDKEKRRTLADSALSTVLDAYDPKHVANRDLAPMIGQFETTRKALRVLSANVFFTPRSFGGATIVAEQMAHRLHARPDTDVVIFTTAPQGVAEPYRLVHYDVDGLPVFAVCVPETSDPTLDFDTTHTLHAFREVIRLSKPDVVHLHSIQKLGALLVDVCKEEQVPVVVTLHDAWWICGRQFMLRGDGSYCFQTQIDLNICSNCVSDAGLNVYRQYRLRQRLEKADVLLTPSAFFRDIYAANGFPLNKLRVNRNGIARPDGFRKSNSEKLRFGFVGGNSQVKGAPMIRKALANISRDDYELVLVDNMTSLGFNGMNMSDWPISGSLRILPAYDQSNMDDYWSEVDVLLFPTQWKESFGLTVREALIRDIWVITTDAGGVVEDVVDGENGDIIPLLDDGTALQAAIERAMARKSSLKKHINPHKDRIADHAQQAEELHGILKQAALDGALAKHRALDAADMIGLAN